MHPQMVSNALNKFKTSDGSGLDVISSFILKAGIPILPQSVSQLFNSSLSAGLFSDSWKIARVEMLSINCESSKTERQELSRTVPMMPLLFPYVNLASLFMHHHLTFY